MEMKLTPAQRRERIRQMIRSDPQIQEMSKDYEAGRTWFEKATKWMPPRLHSKWWTFPGMAHFIYHRVLTLISENMRFPDED